MSKEKVLEIIKQHIDHHDEMSRWLRSEGQNERAQVWVAGSVALDQLYWEIKEMEA